MYWEKIPGMFNFNNIYKERVKESYPIYINPRSGSGEIKKDGGKPIFVEIGTWKGKSAVFMAEEIKNQGKEIDFYTIDLFEYSDGYHEFNPNRDNLSFYDEVLKNIDPVKDYINLIKGKSYEVAKRFEDGSISFLFIDGDHSYEGVKKDLNAWYPKIKSGGIIAGHDYTETSCGVKMAVDEFFLFTGIQINGSSWIFKKL